MNQTIKKYEQLVTVAFYKGEALDLDMTIDEFYSFLQNSENRKKDFFKFGKRIVARGNIADVTVRDINEIENFILQQHKSVQTQLKRILEEREKQHFVTKDVDHLIKIAKKKWLKIK